MTTLRTFLAGAAVAALATVVPAGIAAAHTESDLVAVPAGSPATITLKPTHGCEGSPTVEVAIQVPVAGATAGEVAGWTASAEDDGNGNTVVEWTGGSLPADQHGAFPVTFDVPADAEGQLLTFPAVQVCENGDELSWIDGDPEGEYPAPRLLVLPAGSASAATIDEVPADAPGREQLVEIVDIDGGGTPTSEPTTESTEPNTGGSEPVDDSTTTAQASESTTTTAPAVVLDDEDESDGISTAAIIGIFAAAVAVVVGGGLVLRQRVKADQA